MATKEKRVKVLQTRSTIGHRESQRGTLRALGLGRIGNSVEHTLTPSVVGMLRTISHFVQIEEIRG
jgi:large subunit ribosomal protein L30